MSVTCGEAPFPASCSTPSGGSGAHDPLRDPARAPGLARGHDGRRLRRPRRSTNSHGSSSGAWWSPPQDRYARAGQQVGGPPLEVCLVAARRVASTTCPCRHPGCDELVQGVLDRLRQARRDRERSRVRDRYRAGREGPPAPAAGRRDPRRSGSTGLRRLELQAVGAWLPRYIRWYTHTFGPREELDGLGGSSRSRWSKQGSVREPGGHHEGPRFTGTVRVHRWVRRRRSCSAPERDRRRRGQPLQVRQGGKEATTRTPRTRSSRAMPTTSTSCRSLPSSTATTSSPAPR